MDAHYIEQVSFIAYFYLMFFQVFTGRSVSLLSTLDFDEWITICILKSSREWLYCEKWRGCSKGEYQGLLLSSHTLFQACNIRFDHLSLLLHGVFFDQPD